jgi:phosphodiesterase/alkaline phosphatase D-like protein
MKETRRIFIRKLGYSIALSSISLAGIDKAMAGTNALMGRSKKFILQTNKKRVWLGEDFWAIPLEDWSLENGRFNFIGDLQNARVNILTTQINEGVGSFKIRTVLGVDNISLGKEGIAGFILGINDSLDNDVKAACYYGKGLSVAVSTTGYLLIGDQKVNLPAGFKYDSIELQCAVKRNPSSTEIKVKATSAGAIMKHSLIVQQDISGYFALANNIGIDNGAHFWFKDIEFKGVKLTEKPDQSFGPILWPMYTIHNNTLKMSVQMPPISDDDEKELVLKLKIEGQFKEMQKVQIGTASYQAVFKVDNWTAERDTAYQIVYVNEGKTYKYDGIIKAEPASGQLKVAGLTCQQWVAYPYSPVVKNLEKHKPDLLFFSGDQIYEENGGYDIKRTPVSASILSYLGKWYMFGWTFGKIISNAPTICTPDDHDVFHGNLWGEGGKSMPLEQWTVKEHKDAHGGYVQSPEMVNVVHQTNCAHMPDCPDKTNLPSGITTWYTELTYGGVSFAIISDRMFKSGPEEIRPGVGRIDHIKTPLRPEELEKKDLLFLGNRQMKFLEQWIGDWSGASMKVLLSQTLFANVGTHHGNEKMFLYGDMDSGGWPKKQRDEVIKILRKGYAFHINGDQHLPSMVQYSVDEKRDGSWTFCTPAISTGYIRFGQPDLVNNPHTDRPAHGLPNTGCYVDIFGNNNFVYAVGNPIDNWKDKNRYTQAQNKASGFGIIIFDLLSRNIEMHAYRFLADRDQPTDVDEFPGWPLTIKQTDNDGRNFKFFLPRLKINKRNQLVKVFTVNGELLNVIRVNGAEHQFSVPDAGSGYYVVVGEVDGGKKIANLSGSLEQGKLLEVNV